MPTPELDLPTEIFSALRRSPRAVAQPDIRPA